MKNLLLTQSFAALYQHLDNIKALRIQRAWDELNNIYFLKDKRTLNDLFSEQEVIVDGLFESLHAVEDNLTPEEKDEVIDKLSNLLKRGNA
jgi:hypothetical protein